MTRQRQLALEFRTWGGKRKRAGRPPSGARAGASHLRRPSLSRHHPLHVTWFAAEEILKGHRSRQLAGTELALSVSAVTEPILASMAVVVKGCDQHLAVQELLKMGCTATREAIYAEFERYYLVAKSSLIAVWPAVVAVAQALLKHSELDRSGFRAAIHGHNIYTPVFTVQKAHGIL